MDKSTYLTAGGTGTGLAVVVGWILAHINVYLTAIGWAMTPEVQNAFLGLIVGGGLHALIETVKADIANLKGTAK